jgi:hypothetical protein
MSDLKQSGELSDDKVGEEIRMSCKHDTARDVWYLLHTWGARWTRVDIALAVVIFSG